MVFLSSSPPANLFKNRKNTKKTNENLIFLFKNDNLPNVKRIIVNNMPFYVIKS